MERGNLPIAAAGALAAAILLPGSGLADDARMERFRVTSPAHPEVLLSKGASPAGLDAMQVTISEALTGFDNRTNGFSFQGPPFDSLDDDNVVPRRSFNDNRFIFEEVEAVADGLGPTYNAQSCRECHQNVVTGGASQVAEHRTGRMDGQVFFESLGGSLVHSRATSAGIVERVAFEDNVRTFRISTNTLGAG